MRIVHDENSKLEMVNLYVNKRFNLDQIAEIYNVSPTTISQILKKRGLILRSKTDYRASVNDNYFDVIDTEDKAYFLGLMVSDGCVVSSEGAFQIILAEQDKYILETFIEKIEYKGNLIYKPKFTPTRQNSYGLKVTSNKLKERLIELGCIPCKTLIVEFPKLEIFKNDTLRHFLRGVFDGDGCVYLGTQLSGAVAKYFSVAGSEKLIKTYREILTNLFKLDNVGFLKIKNTYRIQTAQIRNIEKVYNIFYKNSTVFLTRKKEKFNQILTACNETLRGNRIN